MTSIKPQSVSAARRRLQPLLDAVKSGNVETFKAALFDEEPGVVSLRMAQDLRFGFGPDPEAIFKEGMSLAEACFQHGQSAMLRIALEARHPDMVDGFITGPKVSWSRHLSTAYTNKRFAELSLPALALSFSELPQSTDFLDLGLEFDPEDPGAEALEANEPHSAARIRASRMRLQLRSSAAGKAAPEVPAATRSQRQPRLV